MRSFFVALFVLAAFGRASAQACETVMEVLSTSGNFSLLAEAVRAANLTDLLDDPAASLTVFAPTNQAFMYALPALDLTVESLFDDGDMLLNILLMHVVPESIQNLQSVVGPIPTEVEGEQLVVAGLGNNRFRVEAANAVDVLNNVGISACQGMVYIVDGILLPPQLESMLSTYGMEQIPALPQGTQWVASQGPNDQAQQGDEVMNGDVTSVSI